MTRVQGSRKLPGWCLLRRLKQASTAFSGAVGLALVVLLAVSCAPKEKAVQEEGSGLSADVENLFSNITEDLSTECPGVPFGQDLVQPRNIRPGDGNVVNTALTVVRHTHCVPFWYSQDAQGNDVDNPRWEWAPMNLRSYASPADGNNPTDPNQVYSIPGPTYRVSKAYLQDTTQPPGPGNEEVRAGTRFKLLLTNDLPNNTTPAHDCVPSEVFEPPPPGSTGGQRFEEVSPECFHGEDVTNIHYHGTHVSPQPHQDFVLLSLYSQNQTDPAPPEETEYVQVGSYQTDINPFPWNQAPGTHWYHPHKHGSTALQVLNGLSGALLIQGEFDDWLYAYYGVDPLDDAQLETFEKVMVVQQVWTDLNFYHKPHPNYPPLSLVNGQAAPVVRMKPGEVQRFRLIGATMQAAAQLQLDFPPGFTVRQIAQDGVQFAPENYERQPLYPKGEDGNGYLLSPGNRADFLVQAPEVTTAQRFVVTQEVVGHVHEDIQSFLDAREAQAGKHGAENLGVAGAAAKVATSNPPLFVIHVEGENASMTLPETEVWPAMPYYLRDIEDSEVVRSRTVAFSMTTPDGTVTGPGKQRNSFWIDKTQYDESCANYNMQEGTAEDWEVTNDSAPQHPFHIHINPFQVHQDDTVSFEPPYVWQDTIALPKVTNPATTKSVQIRHRFEDYTGGYVIHCHFLGHEDRGMMLNVQTVCPEGTPDSWNYGTPVESGGADDCTVPSPVPALPSCSGDF